MCFPVYPFQKGQTQPKLVKPKMNVVNAFVHQGYHIDVDIEAKRCLEAANYIFFPNDIRNSASQLHPL